MCDCPLIGPSAIQLGPMKTGTTSLKNFFEKFSNLNVSNLPIDPLTKRLVFDDKFKFIVGSYLRRNLQQDNSDLVPYLKSWTKTPLIIPLRDPLKRFESHLYHFLLKSIVTRGWKCNVLKIRFAFPNSYCADFDIKKIDEENLSSFKALTKGLYYQMLKNIIDTIPQERFLFFNTDNLSSPNTSKMIVNHIKKVNGYQVTYEKDKTISILNSRKSMREEFFKGRRKWFIRPRLSVKISDYSKRYLIEMFREEHIKLLDFKPYRDQDELYNFFKY